jgi:hypothetical protein
LTSSLAAGVFEDVSRVTVTDSPSLHERVRDRGLREPLRSMIFPFL